jgi:hypothetical protein
VDDTEVITSGSATNLKPDNGWLRYDILEEGRLYAKGGRFELEIPFTQARTPHLFPYEVYGATTGFEPASVGVHKDGLEVGGDLPHDFRFAAAVVAGNSEDLAGNRAGLNPNAFLRVSKRFDRNRVGVFSYFGKSTIALSGLQWEDHHFQVGADASVWVGHLNLYGLYLYGSNDNSVADLDHPAGTMVSASESGGFLQADFQALDFVKLTARGSVVRRPPGVSLGPSETFSSFYPGIQIFIVEHGKVSFEYGFFNQGQKGVGQVQAEFAF